MDVVPPTRPAAAVGILYEPAGAFAESPRPATPARPAALRGALDAPIKVIDVELAHGLTDIDGCAGYIAVHALVRRRGHPIGWLTIAEPDAACVPAERVREAIATQLGPALVTPFLAERIGTKPAVALPPVSIVVCTRDRTEEMEGCLGALAALDYPEHEVIVVDNAPRTDETARLVAEYPGVRYVREGRPGLDWARNRGITEARHDIIAFTDDDARADVGWLRGIARAFADPSVGAVTGHVAPAELETEAQQIFELVYGGMGKGKQARHFRGDTMRAFSLVGAHHMGVGANMAFRRSVLEAAGGFDTALDVGTPSHGGGDLDMFHRVVAAGTTLRYEPSALVWHRHRQDMAGLRRQLRDNGRAFGVFLLTIWYRRQIPRHKTAQYAVRVWARWLVERPIKRLLGREAMPMSLLLAELRGALDAPHAYRETYRRDREIKGRG
ncbi:MAG: glycosyltransferase [Gemmatimonadaceae bacterium]